LRRCGGSRQELKAPIDSLETCAVEFRPELEARVAEYVETEIASSGGHPFPELSARVIPRDPLTALRKSDPSLCQQVEVFAKVLGASVDMVVPRGAPDLRMAGSMTWPTWERCRLEQVFRTGRITMAEAHAREGKKRAESSAWLEHWRKVQRGWANITGSQT
jgi:hypothetical protein